MSILAACVQPTGSIPGERGRKLLGEQEANPTSLQVKTGRFKETDSVIDLAYLTVANKLHFNVAPKAYSPLRKTM